MNKTKKEWIDLFTSIANYKGQEEKIIIRTVTVSKLKDTVKWSEKIINKQKTNRKTRAFLVDIDTSTNKYAYEEFLLGMEYRDSYFTHRVISSLKENSPIGVIFKKLFKFIEENKQVETFAIW